MSKWKREDLAGDIMLTLTVVSAAAWTVLAVDGTAYVVAGMVGAVLRYSGKSNLFWPALFLTMAGWMFASGKAFTFIYHKAPLTDLSKEVLGRIIVAFNKMTKKCAGLLQRFQKIWIVRLLLKGQVKTAFELFREQLEKGVVV